MYAMFDIFFYEVYKYFSHKTPKTKIAKCFEKNQAIIIKIVSVTLNAVQGIIKKVSTEKESHFCKVILAASSTR